MKVFYPILTLVMHTLTAVSEPGVGASIYYYDMSALRSVDLGNPQEARRAWDTAHLVTSIQGIVNADGPVLFVRFMQDTDDFWFDYVRGESGWLTDRPVQTLSSLDEVLNTFAPMLKGVVVYDDRVPATSNLASTIAGIEGRACLRFDNAPESIYANVMALGLPFSKNATRLIKEDGSPLFTGEGRVPGTETPSTGSAKCDAYLWAKHTYLDTGLASKQYMAYYLDAYWLQQPRLSGFSNATLTNHDFFIANKAFFFDLGVWPEESPVDEPNQPAGTDRETLLALLQSMHTNAKGDIIHIGGFTPWVWKYTNHGRAGGGHGGVDTEWEYARIISAFNGIMDADALGYSGMANASFYQHFPLKKKYKQNPRPTVRDLKRRGLLLEDGTPAKKSYVCFYRGDYDAAAWFNYHVPLHWKDPAYGQVPTAWAFNPILDQRAPHVMHYVRTNASANDWFIFGDSGAGYLNPGMLLEKNRRRISGLPDGMDTWIKFCKRYARVYDLSITGFIIDGHSPPMGEQGLDAYLHFSPDGIVGQKLPAQTVYKDTMPIVRMKTDLGGSPADAGATIARMAGVNAPKFMFMRTILKSPGWHAQCMEIATTQNPNVEFVDPYTFFLLVKAYEENKDILTKQSSRVMRVEYSPDATSPGMLPILVSDGPFTQKGVGTTKVMYQAHTDSTRYLYFEVANAFAGHFQNNPGQSARLTLHILDTTPGAIAIHYNAHQGSPYRSTPRQSLPGNGEWIELVFDLPHAAFAHRQNGGADLRIVNFGTELNVKRVVLERSAP